jgi:hypothetical protein
VVACDARTRYCFLFFIFYFFNTVAVAKLDSERGLNPTTQHAIPTTLNFSMWRNRWVWLLAGRIRRPSQHHHHREHIPPPTQRSHPRERSDSLRKSSAAASRWCHVFAPTQFHRNKQNTSCTNGTKTLHLCIHNGTALVVQCPVHSDGSHFILQTLGASKSLSEIRIKVQYKSHYAKCLLSRGC